MKEEKLVRLFDDEKRNEKWTRNEEKYRFNKVNLQYNFFAPFKCKMPFGTVGDVLMKSISFFACFFFRLQYGASKRVFCVHI